MPTVGSNFEMDYEIELCLVGYKMGFLIFPCLH